MAFPEPSASVKPVMSQKKSQEEDTLGRNLTLTPVGPERVKWQETH